MAKDESCICLSFLRLKGLKVWLFITQKGKLALSCKGYGCDGML